MNEATDDWQEIWQARSTALDAVFGAAAAGVLHAPHPFELGGNADVLAYPLAAGGTAFVTAELSGKPHACYADYELMICQRGDSTWGAGIISRLAAYAQRTPIRHGESMDIDSATPDNCAIKAFVFDTWGRFTLFDTPFELRLCIGITKNELAYKLEHGSSKLLAALKQGGIHPYTDLRRGDIPLGRR